MATKSTSSSSSTLTPLLQRDSPLPRDDSPLQDDSSAPEDPVAPEDPIPSKDLIPSKALIPAKALLIPLEDPDAITPVGENPAEESADEFTGRILLQSDCLVLGRTIYKFGKRSVIEHTRPDGSKVMVKFSKWEWRGAIQRSEAHMAQYAATHGVLAPKILGVYDVAGHDPSAGPVGRAIVMEKVPGEALIKVWHKLSPEQQQSIKDQLRELINIMRTLTRPYIGRLGFKATWNIFNVWQPHSLGPFQDQKSFDDWCLRRIRPKAYRSYRYDMWKYRRVLEANRKESTPQKFVLTHGDLSPRNIMVQDGKITGLIDWQMSGFLPEWVEYANATVIASGMEEWWIPVLKEVIPPCSKGLARLAFHIEEHPEHTYGDEQDFDFDD